MLFGHLLFFVLRKINKVEAEKCVVSCSAKLGTSVSVDEALFLLTKLWGYFATMKFCQHLACPIWAFHHNPVCLCQLPQEELKTRFNPLCTLFISVSTLLYVYMEPVTAVKVESDKECNISLQVDYLLPITNVTYTPAPQSLQASERSKTGKTAACGQF